MTDLEIAGGVIRLVEGAVDVLVAVGARHQAEKLRRAPIRPSNQYACANRALFAVEASLRGEMAGQSRSPLLLAVEAVVLVRSGLDAAANAYGPERPPALAWLVAINGRQRAILEACQRSIRPPG